MSLGFTSRLVKRVSAAVKGAHLKRLSDDEKRAVLRLLHAVALSDGVLAAAELEELRRVASALGTQIDLQLALPDAVQMLAQHERTMKLACLLVADAFFVDGDYDEREQKFVAGFAERFTLPTNPLRDAVEKLRQKKLDDALAEWSAGIA